MCTFCFRYSVLKKRRMRARSHHAWRDTTDCLLITITLTYATKVFIHRCWRIWLQFVHMDLLSEYMKQFLMNIKE